MEGGIYGGVDKLVFRECFFLIWKNFYVFCFVFFVGIGGFFFGYDIGKFFNLLFVVLFIYIYMWFKFDGFYIYM